jgi:hypothetical protein
MAEASPVLSEQSLCNIFADCLTSYRKLLLALHAENCNVVRLELVDVTRILDEFGRAKTWGDQAKATFPSRARGSLDDTLRNSPELRGTVREILDRLRWCLGQGRSFCIKYAISSLLTRPQHFLSRRENMIPQGETISFPLIA